MEEFCLWIRVGVTEQSHGGGHSPSLGPTTTTQGSAIIGAGGGPLVGHGGLPDHVEGDAGHADHQPHRVDGRDVRGLDEDGEAETEDLLDDPGHAEGEARGVGDQEVLGHLHEEGNEASRHDSADCGHK